MKREGHRSRRDTVAVSSCDRNALYVTARLGACFLKRFSFLPLPPPCRPPTIGGMTTQNLLLC